MLLSPELRASAPPRLRASAPPRFLLPPLGVLAPWRFNLLDLRTDVPNGATSMDIPVSKDVGAASRVAALPPIHGNLKPEWLRVPEAVRLFGLSRSHLYELIAAGAIKSTALKKHGATRGIRLLSFDSLSAYIERAANGEGLDR